MELTRRDFLKASTAVGAALGFTATGLLKVQEAQAAEGSPQVIWLAGQCCTGCSVSLLNSIYYTTIDDLLVNTLDLQYHPQLSAAAGTLAQSAITDAYNKGGYILVVEGAIPTGSSGKYCTVWPGMTIKKAVTTYAAKASYILAVGSCASFGGMSAGHPNPTKAKAVSAVISSKYRSNLVNLPGCPAHPDWVVGTVAYVLQNGKLPPLDASRRPTDYFGKKTHDQCPNLPQFNATVGPYLSHAGSKDCVTCHGDVPVAVGAPDLGQAGCLYALGCKGRKTSSDCPTRQWNSGAAQTPGVNWCIGAGSPCIGCTEPTFPDGMSPFFVLTGGGGGGGGSPPPPAIDCSRCHSDGRTGSLPRGHPAVQ